MPITSLCIKVEVNAGAHINKVAADAVALCQKLDCGIMLYFDRCEIMVIQGTPEEDIINEFKEY